MKTQTASAQTQSVSPLARIPYTTCPLCEGTKFMDLRGADCSKHPLYRKELPREMNWIGCDRCGHLFTDGYFSDEALEILFAKANKEQTTAGDLERQRAASSSIVDRVSQIRGSIEGRWLDVGMGSGSLMTTAAEFGYDAVGVDVRPHAVKALTDLGYDTRQTSFENFQDEEGFDVISMADVLEHIPYPRRALAHAMELLRPGGVMFFSMPNVDTHTWKVLDAESRNPYWGEIEHYHNFSRGHLYWLLGQMGYQPCHYMISSRYIACMEVCAWRSEDLPGEATEQI